MNGSHIAVPSNTDLDQRLDQATGRGVKYETSLIFYLEVFHQPSGLYLLWTFHEFDTFEILMRYWFRCSSLRALLWAAGWDWTPLTANARHASFKMHRDVVSVRLIDSFLPSSLSIGRSPSTRHLSTGYNQSTLPDIIFPLSCVGISRKLTGCRQYFKPVIWGISKDKH